MSINPINSSVGAAGAMGLPVAAKPAAGPDASGGGFAGSIKEALDNVSRQQDAVGAPIQDLLAGRSQDVLPVVDAVARADLSFKLLVGVRNKVIEAYKQTMNMQV
jgi:flagellar hook-basal body complex protein FliE